VRKREMAYVTMRIIALLAVAVFAIPGFLGPLVDWDTPPSEQALSITLAGVYILVCLIPHRFIVRHTWVHRGVMTFMLSAFIMFPFPMIWPCLIPSPMALQMSRDRVTRRSRFREALQSGGR
jgi:hypothetical protein